jgi:ketosteroid isomerase-like protein
MLRRDEVMRWVAGYESAWRDGDLDAVAELFTDDATYLRSPYEPPDEGVAAIRSFWLEDEGKAFTMEAEPVAVEGQTAVVRALVRYGEPVDQEYTDMWVLRFAADGRVEHFEEWPFWPGKPFSVDRPEP